MTSPMDAARSTYAAATRLALESGKDQHVKIGERTETFPGSVEGWVGKVSEAGLQYLRMQTAAEIARPIFGVGPVVASLLNATVKVQHDLLRAGAEAALCHQEQKLMGKVAARSTLTEGELVDVQHELQRTMRLRNVVTQTDRIVRDAQIAEQERLAADIRNIR